MAFKPNYNQQRAERNRLKQAKREEKLRLQQERTAQRKSMAGGESEDAPEGEAAGERESPATGS
jgi:hypothetical protein